MTLLGKNQLKTEMGIVRQGLEYACYRKISKAVIGKLQTGVEKFPGPGDPPRGRRFQPFPV